MRQVHTLSLLVLTLCSLQSFGVDPAERDPRQIPRWREPSRATLELRGGKSENVAKWSIRLGKQGDFLLDVTQSSGADSPNGQVLVLGGQVMAIHGLELEKDYEIDALDMPAFHFQLLYGLLEALFPDGPDSVSESQKVDRSENDASIPVGTASATGEFAAPWFVLGTVSRQDEHTIDYDLSFTFTVDLDTASMFKLRLRGTWSGGRAPQDIGDDFNIQGWTIYTIGPFQTETDNGEVTEYGAQPTGASYRTAGELRATLADVESSQAHQ